MNRLLGFLCGAALCLCGGVAQAEIDYLQYLKSSGSQGINVGGRAFNDSDESMLRVHWRRLRGLVLLIR